MTIKERKRLKLVVIGNGMAGIRCVEEILKRDPQRYAITVIGDEPHPNYNRILLSKVLQGGAAMDEIVLNPLKWYQEQGISLVAGDRAMRIDVAERLVETAGGGVHRWDKLIIATGSSAYVPPIIGADKKGVIAFRKLEDCEAMIKASEQYRKAAVIGGGLLGLEAARGLLNLGMETVVVHNAPYLMNRQLDQTAAAMLRERLEEQGMTFRMNAQTAGITGLRRAKGLLFGDGSRLEADLIVLAVGIKPNVELAAECGIKTNRAICVDDYMRTSEPDIYAVGECAEHRGVAYGLVAPLYEQAGVLAGELCGSGGEPYLGTVPYAQLKVAGVEVFSAGEIRDGEAQTALSVLDGINGVYRKITMSEGKVAGAILFGDATEGQALLKLIKAGSPVGELAAFLGAGNGDGGLNAAEKAAAAMPASENVCACNAVDKASIVKAIRDGGLETVEQVKQATRATGSCGGCQPVVSAILSLVRSGQADSQEALGEAVGESGGTAEAEVCGCMGLNHTSLRKAVMEYASSFAHSEHGQLPHGPFNLERLLESLGWRTPKGCELCLPAIRYYWTIGCDLAGFAGGNTGEEPFGLMLEAGGAFLQPIQLAAPASSMTDESILKQMVGHWTSTWGNCPLPAPITPALSAGARYPVGLPIRDIALAKCPAGWELFAGGSAELPVRQSKLVGLAEHPDEAMELADACLQLYREDAHYGEVLGEWLERAGLNAVRMRLLDLDHRKALAERLRGVPAQGKTDWGVMPVLQV